MQIEDLQEAIRASGLEGWLFFDHHRRDPLAYRILGISTEVEATRRWYYFVPAHGEARKLVHRIENRALDSLPGQKNSYSSWKDQHEKLKTLLAGCSRIAMQYSPNCAIPYISLVDAGTVELIRAAGIEVVSSAGLVQEFEARWTGKQLSSHLHSGKLVDQIRRDAFDLLGERLRAEATITEYEIQQFILGRFSQSFLITGHGPIVAVNEHASDPHYEPTRDNNRAINVGDFVLIDLWAKSIEPGSVYYDVTWTGYCGNEIPLEIQNVFEIVRDARKKAALFVTEKAARAERFAGFEVDDVARGYIEQKGYGEAFFHRTGHSIGTDVHGTGANMDNLEAHDERLVIPNTCFSIEPGIYLPKFGVRSEVNMYVGNGFAQVTGEQQEQLIRI
ncbi:MAG: M24 family metallopeptidase [Acidobacteriota bacterium]|nr:M24 family metallopeptidase [Acidobacteriota bacterium]